MHSYNGEHSPGEHDKNISSLMKGLRKTIPKQFLILEGSVFYFGDLLVTSVIKISILIGGNTHSGTIYKAQNIIPQKNQDSPANLSEIHPISSFNMSQLVQTYFIIMCHRLEPESIQVYPSLPNRF